jgi:hypothetical protein
MLVDIQYVNCLQYIYITKCVYVVYMFSIYISIHLFKHDFQVLPGQISGFQLLGRTELNQVP